MKSVILLILSVGIIVVTGELKKGKLKCDRDVPYEENDCNECECTGEKLLCNLRRTCKAHLDRTTYNCEMGTTWDKDCNQCWCTEHGTVCTTYLC